MSGPRPSVPPRPVHDLAGEELETYAGTAARLVLTGRLSRLYPDPFACAAYLRALAPSVRGDVYPGIRIDLGSGLPALRDLASVQADREIAAGFVAEAPRPGRAPSPRVAAKERFYRRLLSFDLPPLARLEVALRRLDPARRAASFVAVFDRFDPAEGVFARTTLLLEQEDRTFGDPFLARRGDDALQTPRFREAMERLAQDESEIAFLLLGREPGIRIEEVARGRVGPLWGPHAPSPPGWTPEGGRDWVLHFPFDRAALDLPGDRDDDPFATRYARFLSAPARSLVEGEARRLGYRVQKDRKFACTPGAEATLRARLAEAGTRNLVYVLPPGPPSRRGAPDSRD